MPLPMCLFPGDWPQRNSGELYKAERRGGIRSLVQCYTHPLRHLPPTQDHARYVRVSTTHTALNTCTLGWEWRQGYCGGLTHALSVLLKNMTPTVKLINVSVSKQKMAKINKYYRGEIWNVLSWLLQVFLKCYPSNSHRHLPSLLLWLSRCSRKKSVGPLTTGTVMCNYSVTPGCPSPIPPPPPRCVSAPPVPTTSLHTHTHTPR